VTIKLAQPSFRVLRQRYELARLVGSGASGWVYEATDLLLNRRVAVKYLDVSATRRSGFMSAQDFMREARTLALLKHPNIVEIYDVGQDDTGVPFFVMELLTDPLSRLLAAQGSLSVKETLSLLLPLCGALACAHDRGILHCDLKPENIMVQRVHQRTLQAKLLDFGIARQTASAAAVDLVYGTPGYVAPEQASGAQATPRSDVWALGVVAFRCLSGRLPLAPLSGHALLERTVAADLPSLGAVARDVPESIVRAIDRALERAPDRRYPDMRAFAKGLVGAALQARVALSSDPDPIGLPEVHQWCRASGANTQPCVEHAPRANAPSVEPLVDVTRPGAVRQRWLARTGLVLALGVSPSGLWSDQTEALGREHPATSLSTMTFEPLDRAPTTDAPHIGLRSIPDAPTIAEVAAPLDSPSGAPQLPPVHPAAPRGAPSTPRAKRSKPRTKLHEQNLSGEAADARATSLELTLKTSWAW